MGKKKDKLRVASSSKEASYPRTSESRSAPVRWILAAILLVGVVLRAWYLAEILNAPDFAAPQQDPDVMDWYARALVTGDWTVREGENDPEMLTTPYFRPPGHAYYLAAIYYFTKCSYLAPRIVNMFLGLLSILLMFRLAKRLHGETAGLIVAFFMATYWVFVFWEGELNDPCLFVFLGAALMNVLWEWGRGLGARWAALAGLICGCYALMRPNILLFGPFIAFWMAWVAYRRGQWRRIPASWAALLCVTIACIAPVTVRNYRVSGEFVPISTYFGENFMIGNGEDSDGVTPWTPYLQDLEGTGNWSVWVYNNVVKGLGKELGIKNMTHSGASSYFVRKTLKFIKEHPWRTIKLAAVKAVLFWTPIEITCNKVVHYEKRFYAPLKYLPGFAMVMALLVVGLMRFALDWRAKRLMTGLPGAESRARDLTILILLFMLTYYLSFLPFFVNGRARVPVIPFAFLFGAYVLCRIGEYFRNGERRRAAGWTAALCAAYGLASVQYIGFEPDLSRWHYQRAESYMRQGKVDEAIAAARPILDRPETASYMHMRLARLFAKAGRKDEAFQHLMAALQRHPNDPDVRLSGAAELIKIGRIEEGIEHYNETLRLNPNDAVAHNNLGVLLEDQGKFDEAYAHYSEAVRSDPALPVARNNLGNLMARLGHYEEAIRHFAKAVEDDPKQQDYHYNLGVQLANAGYTEKAIERYRIALELDPNDARAHNNLGLLLAEKKEYVEAEKHYREALRIVPEFVLVYANWGNMLVDQGRLDDGIAMYRQGLDISPEDAGLHNGLGYLYAQAGKDDLAKREYEEALRIAPNYPLALNNLGNLYNRQNRPDEAIRCYQRALAIDPRDRFANANLGDVYSNQGRWQEAAEAYSKAIEINPSNAVAANGLASALIKLGRIEEGIRFLEKALSLDPKFAAAHYNYGAVLAAAGQTAKAIEHFKAALAIAPDFQLARDMLDRLGGG